MWKHQPCRVQQIAAVTGKRAAPGSWETPAIIEWIAHERLTGCHEVNADLMRHGLRQPGEDY